MAVPDGVIACSPADEAQSDETGKANSQDANLREFKAIVADIRAQRFSADAQDSADFVEFIGLAGLGQAEASALTGE